MKECSQLNVKLTHVYCVYCDVYCVLIVLDFRLLTLAVEKVILAHIWLSNIN